MGHCRGAPSRPPFLRIGDIVQWGPRPFGLIPWSAVPRDFWPVSLGDGKEYGGEVGRNQLETEPLLQTAANQ